MFKVTRLIHLSDPADEMTATVLRKRITAAAESTTARRVVVEPTLPGVRNGGHVLVHLQFTSPAEWDAGRESIDSVLGDEAIVHIDGVEYLGSQESAHAGRRTTSRPPTLYRTLLLRVEPTAPDAEVARFEHATLQMPVHVRDMCAWQLSPVLRAEGSSRWTHVWEQEFTDVDALLGQYMHHPVHWALVDRWFDPECPDCIITDRVCHTFCALPAPVIDAVPAARSAAEEG